VAMTAGSEPVLVTVAAHLTSGAVTSARRVWDAAHAAGDPLASDLLLAEIEERSGDQLWFADRPGSAAHYRLAQDILLPRAVQFDAEQHAELRQQAWTRISNKLLYGTASNGCRRANAVGAAHPHGCPPLAPDATALPLPATAESEPTSVTILPAESIPSPTPDPEVREEPPAFVNTSAPLIAQVTTMTPTSASPATAEANLHEAVEAEGESYDHLVPGHRYRVATTFTDFDGTVWREGFVFRYRTYNYFPYDEGLTLYHDQGSIRLCGLFDDQLQIMQALDRILVAHA